MLGDPALHMLWRRKLRGSIRRQLRRLRSPTGILLGLCGGVLFLGWFSSLFFYSFLPQRGMAGPDEVVTTVRAAGLMLTIITFSGALQHRGLSLPAQEVERLFSAPIAPSDLVRYRLVVNLGRSMLGGIFLGLMFTGRAPRPLFGFLGVLVAMGALSVLGQTCALVSGAAEKRVVRFLKFPARVLAVLILPVLALLAWSLASDRFPGDLAFLSEFTSDHPDGLMGTLRQWFEHPVLRALVVPFEPWARAIAATTHAEFWPWFGLCLLLWYALFELTARIPIDFRELSLETAASTAEKLRRFRRVGGGASATKAVRGRWGRKPPWVFGRGPGGAIAWRKWVEILRKARGTLWISTLVLCALMIFSGVMDHGGGERSVLGQATLVAVLGTLYLCSGLRFDFRDDLDRMEYIKAWPVSSRRLFLCSLLPETLLVSVLLIVAIALRLVLSQEYPPSALAIMAFVPPVVFAWLALDNAVFLFAPVRFVPGQDGALQNAGRALLLVFLRGVVVLIAGGLVVGLAFLVGELLDRAGVQSDRVLLPSVLGVAYCVLLGLSSVLVVVGGWLLGRFDVSRDRG